MNKKSVILVLIITLLFTLLTGCSLAQKPPDFSTCINLGNCLEAPKNQAWDVPMDIRYFSIMKQAGFKCVRLPVRFSDYVDRTSNYTIDEAFMQKIDSYLNEAIAQDLTVILDLHHFTEIMENPSANEDCLLQIWNQLSIRYKDYPDNLIFEVLNEPTGNLDSNTWNNFLADTVAAIRKNDKKHYLIVGGASFNSIDSLDSLILPDDDKLIVTVHYYEPNEVTFQNNMYIPEYAYLSNVTWEGTAKEKQYMHDRLNKAKSWADDHNVPLFIGEFGVNKNAPRQTRLNWTKAFVKEAASQNIDWGYWEFASLFGVYDLSTNQWDNDLLQVLVNNE